MWIKKFFKKYKYSIIGLCGILCVIIFTSSILNMYKETSMLNSSSEINKLEAINKEAKEREERAIIQRDKFIQENREISIKVSRLEGKTDQQSATLNGFQLMYIKNSKELNKIKNEKDYIPDNVPVSKQAQLLSEYQYKPY